VDDQRLDARVAALETGQDQLLKAVHDLGRKLDERSATPWRAVLASAGLGIALAAAPIKLGLDALGHQGELLLRITESLHDHQLSDGHPALTERTRSLTRRVEALAEGLAAEDEDRWSGRDHATHVAPRLEQMDERIRQLEIDAAGGGG